MNSIFNRAKEYFEKTSHDWQKRLPYSKDLSEQLRSKQVWINQLIDRLHKLEEEKADLKEAADNLLILLNEANEQLSLQQIVGEGYSSDPMHHMNDNPLPTHYSRGIYDDIDDPIDKWEPPKVINTITQAIELYKDKLKEEFDTDEETALGEFDKIRLGEAEQIEQFVRNNYSLTIKAINNRNRVEAEVEKRAPLTLTSQMTPKESIKITNVKVLGEEGDVKYKPLPVGVDYAIVRLYTNNRMRVDYYKDDQLLNPSIEDKDLLHTSFWRKIINYIKE